MFKKEIGELETVIYLLQCRAKTVIITIRLMHTFESCQSLFPMRILELASSSYKLMRLATTLASAFVFLSKDLSRKMLDALPSFSSCLIIAEQSSSFSSIDSFAVVFLVRQEQFRYTLLLSLPGGCCQLFRILDYPFFFLYLCCLRCVYQPVIWTAKCHTYEELGFCHCSLIISSHVPVNENMKNLFCLSDSNCSMSPAAIWVLNNLFRYWVKVGPATMLFASCSSALL